MLKIKYQGQFKKDLRLAIKRGFDQQKIQKVIGMLANQIPLPEEYKDHKLNDSRKYKGVRECHIEPDWLLIYSIDNDVCEVLNLIRTGTHSDLF